MHQVDDFAVAAPGAKISNMLMDLIDKKNVHSQKAPGIPWHV